MRLRTIQNAALGLAAALLAGGCATAPSEPSEPQIRTVTVHVPQPIPCPALAQLGDEPEYPDTDAAIRAADNVAELAFLFATGRKLRIQRLKEYEAAATACNF